MVLKLTCIVYFNLPFLALKNFIHFFWQILKYENWMLMLILTPIKAPVEVLTHFKIYLTFQTRA